MQDLLRLEAVIQTLGYSGLMTIEAILGGYETPLIDVYGLRELVPTLLDLGADVLKPALTARKAQLANRRRTVIGHGCIEGYEYDVVTLV